MMLDIIDGLCQVIQKQAELIRLQSEAILQCEIEDSLKDKFCDKQQKINDQNNLLEYRMRRL